MSVLKSKASRMIMTLLIVGMFTCGSVKAQETGPLLMKQELGYTLGGAVAGAGLAIVVWFTDPLNPDVGPSDLVKEGLVVGTFLGAMFGFYVLQNAVVVPGDNTLPTDLENLLGLQRGDSYAPSAANSSGRSLSMKVFDWRF